MQDNISGTGNVAIGDQALVLNTTGSDNVAIGRDALQLSTESQNVAIGAEALMVSTAQAGTAVGYRALKANTTVGNTAIGWLALWQNTSGMRNTGVGEGVMQQNTTGDFNTAIGQLALLSNIEGIGNSALGASALSGTTTGSNNTGIGRSAGPSSVSNNRNVTGSNNTFIGYESGPGSPTQLTNATALGSNAVVSQDNSLVLGSINGVNDAVADVDVGIGTATPAEKLDIRTTSTGGHIYIGEAGCGEAWGGVGFGTSGMDGCSTYSLLGNGVNTYLNRPTGGYLYFRENNGDQVLIEPGGFVGMGTGDPADRLHVAGNIRVSACIWNGTTVYHGVCVSDARYKKNIVLFGTTLDKVAALQPVHFDWRVEDFPEKSFGEGRSFGLIAQEVEQVLPELVTEDEDGYKAVNYSKLPLLNTQAIGELKAKNDALSVRVNEQQEIIENQDAQINELLQMVLAMQERLGVEVSEAR